MAAPETRSGARDERDLTFESSTVCHGGHRRVTVWMTQVVTVGEGPRTDRILTVPNVITVVRLALLPVFLWLLFAQEDRASAALLLAVLGATDFLDGYIARHFNQVSDLGKVLDPVADRLLFFVGVGGHPDRRQRAGLVRRRRPRARGPGGARHPGAGGARGARGSTSRGSARPAPSS